MVSQTDFSKNYKVKTLRQVSKSGATAKVTWRLFVTLLVPIGIAVAGAARVFLRKRAKRNYLKALLLPESG